MFPMPTICSQQVNVGGTQKDGLCTTVWCCARRVHSSHRVRRSGPITWCTMCGAYSSNRSFARQCCPGTCPSDTRSQRLRQLVMADTRFPERGCWNIDFNISGIPDETVKRSQSFNIHDLIQRIVSHPQQEAVQNDLEQHQSFNAFSDESKVAIMDAGNTEICEIVNVEPKWQCKMCLKHCSTGIIYCTCGHLMTKDSAENRKYISAVLDTFSIPNFYIRKHRPHGHRYGKAPGCKDYFTANQLAKK